MDIYPAGVPITICYQSTGNVSGLTDVRVSVYRGTGTPILMGHLLSDIGGGFYRTVVTLNQMGSYVAIVDSTSLPGKDAKAYAIDINRDVHPVYAFYYPPGFISGLSPTYEVRDKYNASLSSGTMSEISSTGVYSSFIGVVSDQRFLYVDDTISPNTVGGEIYLERFKYEEDQINFTRSVPALVPMTPFVSATFLYSEIEDRDAEVFATASPLTVGAELIRTKRA